MTDRTATPSRTTPVVSRALRTDIQALRGFAVLVVLLFHAKLGGLAGGYLGVDVFFVISGFLITRLVADGLRARTFSFSAFYLRRAKRLLPAAYLTFFVTAMLAPFFLNDPELMDFRSQLLGALSFCANIVLWRQSGYFEGAAELKPLLHVWSLSIEEQYYFVLPALMVFVPFRWWRRVLLASVLASMALFMFRAGRDSTFFLLPSRAWEMGIGSLGALVVPSARSQRALRYLFWPSIGLLVSLPFCVVMYGDARIGAACACLSTLVVLLRQHPEWDSVAPVKILSRIGDMSYSLYLVHWPLFAFFSNSWFGGADQLPPLGVRLGITFAALMLGFVLHRYVERPAHFTSRIKGRAAIALGLSSSLALIACSFAIDYAMAPSKNYAFISRVNVGLGRACESEASYVPTSHCRNSETPEMLVWGDSYAMHLVPGLVSENVTLTQATKSACGPALGLAQIQMPKFDRAWAEGCIRFNASVLDVLRASKRKMIVVLSSPFNQFVTPGYLLLTQADNSGQFAETQASVRVGAEALRSTVDQIRMLGHKVVVVSPPPHGAFDVARCLERIERKMPVFGAVSDCSIDEKQYRLDRKEVIELLDSLPSIAHVAVVDFEKILCVNQRCRTSANGLSLYRDPGHFSVDGSAYIARTSHLVNEIRRLAR